ncbi:hypothetical protein HK097_007525 [Rhizophlyctis rosea]|uniref:DNA damage-responsive protein 48 n=1 Tax=Rhizophlyctis rosea TaxID=64517 RepID=A0AAD5SEJ9_9FUNG|nr:hypothetical protein HK097_007525 [Rhizophlyctis rosea]
MDKITSMLGGNNNGNVAATQQQQYQQQPASGGGFMDKINGAMGGGAQGEKNEDGLDKAVDFVQEKFMGAGPQNNESAIEQAKDEAISDAIRGRYKAATGKEFLVADKS